MWAIILLSIVLTTNCHVIREATNPERPPELQDNIVNYVQHFRKIISEYITTQYRTTVEDLEKIAIILDDFFKKLASDLHYIIENNGKDWETREPINDGLPNDKFDEIKKNIRQQYPEIEEKSANEMIIRLRENLFETKHKLDDLMKDQMAKKEALSKELPVTE